MWALNKTALREDIATFWKGTKAYKTTQAFHNFSWRTLDLLRSVESPLGTTPERAQNDVEPQAPRKDTTRSISVDSVPFWISKQPPHQSNYERPSVAVESPPIIDDGKASSVDLIRSLPPIAEGKTDEDQTKQRRQKVEQSSDNITKDIPLTMASNTPNTALLKQIEAMINRAITAQMATPQPCHGSNLPD